MYGVLPFLPHCLTCTRDEHGVHVCAQGEEGGTCAALHTAKLPLPVPLLHRHKV